MKVTQVAIRPTEASNAAGRPALTPELLAATGARYSRNNEGLGAILDKIDHNDLDKSVDSIFKMIDYGHQSIADMAPVAMFIDSVSIWLAYYVWSVCPTAGGQESSTRYLRMSLDDLVPPEGLGIAEDDINAWRDLMGECFSAYKEAVSIWQEIAASRPEAARIPRELLDDSSDRAKKQVARMRRNYAFDRARYYLPAATATNVMLVMSARGWSQLCQHLLSHPNVEAQALGRQAREELTLAAPRMLRHATEKPSIVVGIARELSYAAVMAAQPSQLLSNDSSVFDAPATPRLDVLTPDGATGSDFADDLAYHDNRYAWTGAGLRMTAVRFGWQAVALAEIRDLNRHRTGSKLCPFVPVGFYSAGDEIAALPAAYAEQAGRLRALAAVGRRASAEARQLLTTNDPVYVYRALLGTQFPFEHVTTADMFIYEAELRTAAGAHYRYAKHLSDALALWYDRYPETRNLILEGSAEPE